MFRKIPLCLVVPCAVIGFIACWGKAEIKARNAAQAKVATNLDTGLVAHWPLRTDAKDVSGHDLHATNHGVKFDGPGQSEGSTAAVFNGRDAYLEIPGDNAFDPGEKDFSVALWLNTPRSQDDVSGDVLSQYNFSKKRGFQLALKSNAGVTFSQANGKQLQFGIDNNQAEETWTDCGRPGHALLAFAMAVHDGKLFAGTCEPNQGQTGHVYQYDGKQNWTDCGAPDASNAVTALATFHGALYAGTGKYRVAGSALPESQNAVLGGRIMRYDGDKNWIDCGQLPETESVGGLVVYQDRLYASSLYKPAGFFRYDGERNWTDCGVPNGKRVEALGVYNGYLYATSYDEGGVYRFDGKNWTPCGILGTNTQTYSFAVYQGRLFVGTWPTGRVYRFEDIDNWTDVGRLGEELEVMGMLVHNGRLIAGSLPLAEVYEFDGQETWNRLAQLDATPDVKYRRAWTMAEYQGRLFCSTLPSGKIFSWKAGESVMADRDLEPGWRHVAAVKSGGMLKLYVDGKLAATSTKFDPGQFDLGSGQPLRIGFGPNDFFLGSLSDLRLYSRSLSPEEISELAKP